MFPADSPQAESFEKLFVGSIKTIIGHTEGTAGLASVIATISALQNGVIPPNLHFENLSPKVEPYYKHLKIATSPQPWPAHVGEVRRASVNSFGFGGTNAHCILESFNQRNTQQGTSSTLFTPLTFSAASMTSLQTMLLWHLDFLKQNQDTNITDLAYTLQHRRSVLSCRRTITARVVPTTIECLQEVVNPTPDSKEQANIGVRYGTLSRAPKVLGIFTGQGAQWPRMGAELVETSTFVASRIAELDEVLRSLPTESDRPSWSIKDELLAGKDESRVGEAAISQPLCTAIQIILVDTLRAAGIELTAVVGHSSGEIGAAYAAGFISAHDAIRIAYFRGAYAKHAASPNAHAPRGAMMAIGASFEEGRALCCEPRFAGRIQVAAVNSNSSITLSGDEDAIEEAEKSLEAAGKFARRLIVDTAYHSAHMLLSAGLYVASMERSGVQPHQLHSRKGTAWYSSVYEGTLMDQDILSNQYWADNSRKTVLFAPALLNAVQEHGAFDLAVEVGPHPALKGPASTTLDSLGSDKKLPYTGLLSRGQSDTASLSKALGFIWAHLGSESVQFRAVQSLLSDSDHAKVLRNLPPYPFDHQTTFWTGSRVANHFKTRSNLHITDPVLGNPCTEAATPGEHQWRKIFQPSALPWLKGHMLQGQIVFPATGYVSMAVEAIKAVALKIDAASEISLIRLEDVKISRAITFDDDSSLVEAILSISSLTSADETVTAHWACYSAIEGATKSVLNAKGLVRCQISRAQPGILPLVKSEPYNLVSVDEEHFYRNLTKVGYGYNPPFRGLSDIRRKPGYSFGIVTDQSVSGWDDNLVVHPGMLDSALQSIIAAWSYPGDTSLW